MFHAVPQPILDRMRYLEAIDAQDRQDGTPMLQRLRQIPPETGEFLALMAASAPQGASVEIGTSAGYSTLWLALACRDETGRTLTTFEVLEEKVALARETFRLAQVEDVVTLVAGDAREHLADCNDIAFCFLDAEKDVYADCYELVVPRLVPGGLLIADNAINQRETLQPMLDRALSDERVDALIAPIGKGELICRKRGKAVDKLIAITGGYAHRFPEGDEPFQIMTRLLEECGELAQQVNHFESSGVKRAKHGEPDRAALANEIKQTIVGALRVAQYYGVEKELEDSIAWSYQRLKEEGHIE